MPRLVTVAVATLSAARDVGAHLRSARDAAAVAAAEGADVLCLPEAFATNGVSYGQVAEIAQAVDGPIVSALAEVAAAFRMYVVAPLFLRDGARMFDSALLLDRTGSVAGRYDKIHPTVDEMDGGTAPGLTPPPVWRVDFGRIAALICYDVNWPQEWERLSEAGAEVVFWPSAYTGGFPLHAYAQRHEYYVASATYGESRIIDVTGELLAVTGPQYEVVTAGLNLERRVFQRAGNAERLRDLRLKYGRRVRIHWCFDENLFTLESTDPDLAEADVIAELGLQPRRERTEGARRAQDAARSNRDRG